MLQLHLGTVSHLNANPFETTSALKILENGGLLVNDAGRIQAAGDAKHLRQAYPHAEVVDHGEAWLIPGLIDGHSHFPQYYATAAGGGRLLDWLEKSIFPAEAGLADPRLAEQTAHRYIRHLLSCGTTTAMVFGSQYLAANLALFNTASSAGLRMISGMTLMDQDAPSSLLQSAEAIMEAAETLILECKAHSLLQYAITPRFALSCSPAMLECCAALLDAHPECYLQTHINENPEEIAAAARLFSASLDYLDIYDRFGLLTERTVLAHNIHTTERQLQRLKEAECAVCHCPCSNLFLGSGLFPLDRHLENGIPVAIGTDIGAGAHFSMLEELTEAYKVQQLLGRTLTAGELLYLATLGGATALGLQAETGNFEVGKSADFVVIDWRGDDYLSTRVERCQSLEEQLFCLIHLAARCIGETYVQGIRAHAAPSSHH